MRIALALLSIVAPLAAYAQVADVQPFVAVVTTDKTPIRCSDSERFYKVAELAKGTLVLVDGEGQGWSRVSYPQGLFAFVRAEDVHVVGGTGSLVQPSKLKAFNAVAGYEGSYKALYANALPTGTALQVVEPVKDAAGAIAGYKIAAPASAKAYVETRSLRKATDAEAAAFKARTPTPAPSLTPTTLTPATPTTTTTPTTSPASTPAGTPETAPAQPPATSPAIPPVPTPEGVTPTGTEAAAPTEPAIPAGHVKLGDVIVPVITPVKAAESPQDRAVADAEKLESTFRAVWKQPVLEAEVDELLAEYDRAIANVPSNRPSLLATLQHRRQALSVRRDFRETLRRQAADRAKLDQAKAQSDKQLEELAASRYYTMIGQVQPSLVYDGKQLPQMYRIVSVGGVTPRTLGYLRKTSNFDLDTMIGQVVGVIGEAELDRSLQLNLITPVHLDVLKYSPAQPSFPTADVPTGR